MAWGENDSLRQNLSYADPGGGWNRGSRANSGGAGRWNALVIAVLSATLTSKLVEPLVELQYRMDHGYGFDGDELVWALLSGGGALLSAMLCIAAIRTVVKK
ncbi:MAG: hypothetical protein AAB439_00315 [Patescibacteria group bacterium]